jgi:hypothetical protein
MSKRGGAGTRRRGHAQPVTWKQVAKATGLSRWALEKLPPGKQAPRPSTPRSLADYARQLTKQEPRTRKRRPVPLERKGRREVYIRQQPRPA